MARPKKYKVSLTAEEHEFLESMLRKGMAPARVLRRARTLLFAAEGYPHKAIARVLQVREPPVVKTGQRFVEEGLEQALYDRPRPGKHPKLDAKGEATLIALAGSDPPEGRECWTMPLLADKLVQLGVVDSMSEETVRRVVKKTGFSPGRRSTGVWGS